MVGNGPRTGGGTARVRVLILLAVASGCDGSTSDNGAASNAMAPVVVERPTMTAQPVGPDATGSDVALGSTFGPPTDQVPPRPSPTTTPTTTPAPAASEGPAAGSGGEYDGPMAGTGGQDEALSDPMACLRTAPLQASQLRARLEELTGARPALVAGEMVTLSERTTPEGRALARAYLGEHYGALGYNLIEHAYASGVNLIAERPGEGDGDMFFMVSAHLDAVSGSPGADDDGSGVVTALAIADALSQCPLSTSLRFVAFDEEERGLVWASAYAAEVKAGGVERALGMLHFEMTAYDSDGDGRYMIVDCDRTESLFISDTLRAAVDTLALDLTDTTYCTDASDHSAFWSIGVPAIVAGEAFFGGQADPNPCYHRSCDTVADLNFDFMSALTTAAAHAVAELSIASPGDPR